MSIPAVYFHVFGCSRGLAAQLFHNANSPILVSISKLIFWLHAKPRFLVEDSCYTQLFFNGMTPLPLFIMANFIFLPREGGGGYFQEPPKNWLEKHLLPNSLNIKLWFRVIKYLYTFPDFIGKYGFNRRDLKWEKLSVRSRKLTYIQMFMNTE